MSHNSSRTLVVTVGCLLIATSMVSLSTKPLLSRLRRLCRSKAPPPRTTRKTGTVRRSRCVPSHSSADIKGRDAQGIVHATVSAVDTTINRVKVHTPEGQTIVLDMSPASLTSMQVGDPFRSRCLSHRDSRRERGGRVDTQLTLPPPCWPSASKDRQRQ